MEGGVTLYISLESYCSSRDSLDAVAAGIASSVSNADFSFLVRVTASFLIKDFLRHGWPHLDQVLNTNMTVGLNLSSYGIAVLQHANLKSEETAAVLSSLTIRVKPSEADGSSSVGLKANDSEQLEGSIRNRLQEALEGGSTDTTEPTSNSSELRAAAPQTGQHCIRKSAATTCRHLSPSRKVQLHQD